MVIFFKKDMPWLIYIALLKGEFEFITKIMMCIYHKQNSKILVE